MSVDYCYEANKLFKFQAFRCICKLHCDFRCIIGNITTDDDLIQRLMLYISDINYQNELTNFLVNFVFIQPQGKLKQRCKSLEMFLKLIFDRGMTYQALRKVYKYYYSVSINKHYIRSLKN